MSLGTKTHLPPKIRLKKSILPKMSLHIWHYDVGQK